MLNADIIHDIGKIAARNVSPAYSPILAHLALREEANAAASFRNGNEAYMEFVATCLSVAMRF